MIAKGVGISIVVPFFNAADTLGRCLESTVALHELGAELVLVDDGSTDSSVEVAKSWVSRHGGKLIHQSNAGLGAARQAGLDVANSTYVCFLDADDWLESAAWVKAARVGDMTGADVVRCRLAVVADNDLAIVNSRKSSSQVWRRVKPRSVPVGVPGVTTSLYRLSMLRRHGIRFPRVRTAEDLPFVYNVAQVADLMIQIEDVGYVYVQHDAGQLSKQADALPEVLRSLAECSPGPATTLPWAWTYWRMYVRSVAGAFRRTTRGTRTQHMKEVTRSSLLRNPQWALVVAALTFEAFRHFAQIPRYVILMRQQSAAWTREVDRV